MVYPYIHTFNQLSKTQILVSCTDELDNCLELFNRISGVSLASACRSKNESTIIKIITDSRPRFDSTIYLLTQNELFVMSTDYLPFGAIHYFTIPLGHTQSQLYKRMEQYGDDLYLLGHEQRTNSTRIWLSNITLPTSPLLTKLMIATRMTWQNHETMLFSVTASRFTAPNSSTPFVNDMLLLNKHLILVTLSQENQVLMINLTNKASRKLCDYPRHHPAGTLHPCGNHSSDETNIIDICSLTRPQSLLRINYNTYIGSSGRISRLSWLGELS